MAAPLIAAGIAGIGSLIGSIFGKKGADKANAANLAEAQRNRDFQERMSGTAYQRAVQDLKAAGLNPALAYGQGGASAPSGSTAAAQENASAIPSHNLSVIAQTLASTMLTTAQAAKARSEADIAGAEAHVRPQMLDADIALKTASADQANTYAERASQELYELQETFKSRRDIPALDVIKRKLDNLLEAGTLQEKIRAAKLINMLSEANIEWTGSRADVMSGIARVLGPYLSSAASGSAKLGELQDIVESLFQLHNPFSKPQLPRPRGRGFSMPESAR